MFNFSKLNLLKKQMITGGSNVFTRFLNILLVWYEWNPTAS